MRTKILFISHTAYLDGAERSLLTLLEHLNKERYEAFVLFPKDGPLRKMVTALGWKSIIFYMPWWIGRHGKERWRLCLLATLNGLPKRIKFLCKLITDQKIDIVYTNTVTCMDGAIAAKIKNIPHVWHIREMLYTPPTAKPVLPRPIANMIIDWLSAKVIVNSLAVKKDIDPLSNNSYKVKVIYNGFDLEKYDLARYDGRANSIRSKLGLGTNTDIVALVGSFHTTKGQGDFIEAAKIVSGHFENVTFVLVGSGSDAYAAFIRDKIADLGLEKRVYLTGFMEDIASFMHCIDIFVSASWVESFGRVIVEAMAAGKPVIATRSGGSEEIVVDRATGLLVPLKNPPRLADAIMKLLRTKDKAKKMGQRGRERAIELFTIEKYVDNIEKILVSVR